jgi:cbb3-type cytochrome oxidase maturation protein
MNILFLLIPLGLVLVVIMVAAFFWAAKGGQFDDLQTPAVQILLDDDSKPMRHDRKVRDA